MRCGYKKKERNAEDAEEQEEGGERTEEVGWPKVARVEYWNALPEAISVRCPPFALLSCPLQASSSFPSPSLSLSLSIFFSSYLRFAVLPRVSPFSPFVSLRRVPFAKLRSIFHLEFRRSLAINPRIHYGLRGPYCFFFATSARCLCLPTDLLACLPAYLPACLCSLACAGHRLRFASRDHLDDPDASSFGYATSFPVIGPTWVFASTAVIRSCVAFRPFVAHCSCVFKNSTSHTLN